MKSLDFQDASIKTYGSGSRVQSAHNLRQLSKPNIVPKEDLRYLDREKAVDFLPAGLAYKGPVFCYRSRHTTPGAAAKRRAEIGCLEIVVK